MSLYRLDFDQPVGTLQGTWSLPGATRRIVLAICGPV
jgi:hypothetical protein